MLRACPAEAASVTWDTGAVGRGQTRFGGATDFDRWRVGSRRGLQPRSGGYVGLRTGMASRTQGKSSKSDGETYTPEEEEVEGGTVPRSLSNKERIRLLYR